MAQITTFEAILGKTLRDFKRELFIGLPAEVTNVDKYSTQQCINVLPLLQTLYLDGEVEKLPAIHNVPVRLPAVSGGAFTMPVRVGDKVWLSFGSASLDEYLRTEGVLTIPLDSRRATINDCYVELGFPTFISNTTPSGVDMELYYKGSIISYKDNGDLEITTQGNLRANVAGSTSLDCDGTVTVTAEDTLTLNAPNIVINGNTTVNGLLTVSEDAVIDEKSFNTHTHRDSLNGETTPPL